MIQLMRLCLKLGWGNPSNGNLTGTVAFSSVGTGYPIFRPTYHNEVGWFYHVVTHYKCIYIYICTYYVSHVRIYPVYFISNSYFSLEHYSKKTHEESTRPSHGFLVHQAAMFSSNGFSERSNMCDEKSGSP